MSTTVNPGLPRNWLQREESKVEGRTIAPFGSFLLLWFNAAEEKITEVCSIQEEHCTPGTPPGESDGEDPFPGCYSPHETPERESNGNAIRLTENNCPYSGNMDEEAVAEYSHEVRNMNAAVCSVLLCAFIVTFVIFALVILVIRQF